MKIKNFFKEIKGVKLTYVGYPSINDIPDTNGLPWHEKHPALYGTTIIGSIIAIFAVVIVSAKIKNPEDFRDFARSYYIEVTGNPDIEMSNEMYDEFCLKYELGEVYQEENLTWVTKK